MSAMFNLQIASIKCNNWYTDDDLWLYTTKGMVDFYNSPGYFFLAGGGGGVWGSSNIFSDIFVTLT